MFSIKETLLSSLSEFGRNWILLLGSFLVIVGLNVLFDQVASLFREDWGLVYWVIKLVSLVLQILMSIGLTKIALEVVSGRKASFEELFKNYQLFFPYFALYLLTTVVIFVGLIALLVPGIFLAVKLQFWPYFLVEGNGVWESVKKSWQATKGVFWKLLLFDIILGLFNMAGALLLLLGLLVTAPVTVLAIAKVYKKLDSGK